MARLSHNHARQARAGAYHFAPRSAVLNGMRAPRTQPVHYGYLPVVQRLIVATAPTVAHDLGVTVATAQRYLSQLHDEGLIAYERAADGRSRMWHMA